MCTMHLWYSVMGYAAAIASLIPLNPSAQSTKMSFSPRFFSSLSTDEFFRIAFRENFYESVEALQEDLDRWLIHYNTELPHRGYRNRGKRPLDTVLEFADC